jgi:prolipoprotein diacylglyceryltransferase
MLFAVYAEFNLDVTPLKILFYGFFLAGGVAFTLWLVKFIYDNFNYS